MQSARTHETHPRNGGKIGLHVLAEADLAAENAANDGSVDEEQVRKFIGDPNDGGEFSVHHITLVHVATLAAMYAQLCLLDLPCMPGTRSTGSIMPSVTPGTWPCARCQAQYLSLIHI